MKKVTLPIGTKIIFESLANIAATHGEDPDKAIYEMARESISSFTPSGEIGDNPVKAKRINTKDFFKSFDYIFSPKDGLIAKKMKGQSRAEINQTINNVKAATLVLINSFIGNKKDKNFKLFASTVILKTVGILFELRHKDIVQIIDNQGINDLDQEDFVEAVKDIWELELSKN